MAGFVKLLTPDETQASVLDQEDALPDGKGFLTRASSYMLDVVIIGLIGVMVSILAWPLLLSVFPELGYLSPAELGGVSSSALALDLLVCYFLYFSLFEWLHGATPSKLIHKMRVVKLDGSPCGPGAALVRAILRLLDGFFFGIFALISMQPPLNQRLGDRLARTVVVAPDDLSIRKRRPWTRFVVVLLLYVALTVTLFILTVLMMARTTPSYSGGATI